MMHIILEEKELEPYIRTKENGEILIAENEDYGVEVYLDYGNYSAIEVMQDGVVIFRTDVDENDFSDKLEDVYDNYLTANILDMFGFDREDYGNSNTYVEEIIQEREDQLSLAVMDFVSECLDYVFDEEGSIVEDLKEHFLEYMYTKHGLEPYRPMELIDETGNEFVEDYPYSCLFD